MAEKAAKAETTSTNVAATVAMTATMTVGTIGEATNEAAGTTEEVTTVATMTDTDTTVTGVLHRLTIGVATGPVRVRTLHVVTEKAFWYEVPG